MVNPLLENDMLCPIEFGLDVFGGRWKARIICVISTHKAIRYGEIKKELNTITDAVLSSMLKELLRDGLLKRKQYDEIPPRVEYSLTSQGETVLPVLQMVCQWSRDVAREELHKKLPACKECAQLA